MKNYLLSAHLLLRGERGFILVLGLASLVTLSVIGVWAMTNSSLENLIAANEQRYEENFAISEGSVTAEGGEVGYQREDWYLLPDPSASSFGSFLVPETEPDWDPNDRDANGDALTNFNNSNDDVKASEESFWPFQNMLRNGAMELYDYRYLVTYVDANNVGQGFDGSDINEYKFRINSNRDVDIEIGGMIIAAGEQDNDAERAYP